MAQLKNTIIADTGSLVLPSGTTAQRPSMPENGMIRYNTQLGYVEEYRDGAWIQISHTNLPGSDFIKGKVLQTVFNSTTTQVASTSTTFVNSGLGATITPQFASSRLVVYVSLQLQTSKSTTGAGRADTRLRRTRDGSTSTLVSRQFDYRFRFSNSSERYSFTDNVTYNEVANTTGPVTFFMEHRRGAGNGNTSAQWNNQGRSQIIILEVAA